MKKALLVAIGDELLSGLRVEVNCNWLASMFHDAGWKVMAIEVIPDELDSITETISRWAGKVDCAVFSGGLGPTHDDMTREAIASYLNCGLSIDDEAYKKITQRYSGRFRETVEGSRSRQALVPDSARAVHNPEGSALGISFSSRGTDFWAFPGVPSEYRAMASQEILPLLDASECWRSIWVTGWAESLLKDEIKDIVESPELHVSILASTNLIQVVIRGEKNLIGKTEKEIRSRLSNDCLPTGVSSLEEAVIFSAIEKKITLACAESCTGGMVAAALTNVAGASEVFKGSIVCYSNESKGSLLGVSPQVLEEKGAVSGECASMMASGARKTLTADIAVSITGIAGPGGGSEEKPVGTVWFGIDNGSGNESFHFHFPGSRENIRKRSTAKALELLWRALETWSH